MKRFILLWVVNFIYLVGFVNLSFATTKTIQTTKFGAISVSIDTKDTTGFAIYFLGENGITSSDNKLIQLLTSSGFGVALISFNPYFSNLGKDNVSCLSISGEIVRLSQMVEKESGGAAYIRPLLVGTGKGAQLAYLAAIDSNKEFTSLLTIGDASLSIPGTLCNDNPNHMENNLKWTSLPVFTDGDYGRVKKFLEESRDGKLGSSSLILDSSIELPTLKVGANSFAVFYSGDGGWATIDKDIGETLQESGINVVGINSLKYFWEKKDPGVAGEDLGWLIGRYSSRWGESKIILIGFSLGADVLPLIFNHLQDSIKSKVGMIVLLSPGIKAELEMHITDWFFDSFDDGIEIEPEIVRISNVPILCVFGSEEQDTVCRKNLPPSVIKFELPGNHHFNGDYDKVSKLIFDEIEKRSGRFH